MPPKSKTVYLCQQCGHESPKWLGCCPSCNEWNTFQEETKVALPAGEKGRATPVFQLRDLYSLSQIRPDGQHRYHTGLKELDRVLGGGIVKGSLVLLGGDPGIGKSTILLQICEYLGEKGKLKVLYLSGEESAHQIKLRADRLGVTTEQLLILQETDIQSAGEAIQTVSPNLVIIDSIQTMNHPLCTSSPGSVTQVRECTNFLMRLAKGLDIPMFLVGHVNKDGGIAGPKVLEHMVDTVLYFEGDRNLQYRILRAAKNRFGSTNEIAVFEMEAAGLQEVANPSLMLLSGRPRNTSGTCVTCVMEGSRPLLTEVQGLVSKTGFGTPRRTATGFDYNRMSMLIAVLEKRCGLFFSSSDAYVNIVGGLKLDEPAADLAVVLALSSSLRDQIVSDDVVAFGEIGLGGEIRAVSGCEKRIAEAASLGFKTCILPQYNLKKLSRSYDNIEILGASSIRQALHLAL